MKFCIAILVSFTLILQLTQAAKQSREEWENIRRVCFNVLRTSAEARERIVRMQFDEDDTETQCFARCGGILSGIFDDETGTNLERALEQAEGRAGFDEFKSELEQCVAGITPDRYGEDYCKKGFLSFTCTPNALMKHIFKKKE